MNKYEAALKSFEEAYRNVTQDDELTNEKRDSLKELIDKETPMKPVYRIPDISWNKNEKLPHCPTCDWRLDWEQGCHNNKCRQRIDWSEDNE